MSGAEFDLDICNCDRSIGARISGEIARTHGNQGMYLIGQFCGPANLFSKYGDGWLERPYKFIVPAVTAQRYEGPHKWWAPSDHSTFTRVAPGDLALFERTILKPHFDLDLARFGIDVQG